MEPPPPFDIPPPHHPHGVQHPDPDPPSPPPPPPPPVPPPPPSSWASAATDVKHAFEHAYRGYEQYAAPHDELRPVTNKFVDNFNGWGVTIHDSLDTMLLMNLTETFNRAMVSVAKADWGMPETRHAPFFETAIRHLGGLLSAYALSGDELLLDRADDLGTLLSPVFDTGSGLPVFDVNTVTGKIGQRTRGCLAEIASCQPEYTYLGKASKKVKHYRSADRIWRALKSADLSELGGMLPTNWQLNTGQPLDNQLKVGGQADSGHEYLLKQYLQTGKSDKTLLEMYLRTTTHMITHLMYMTPNRQMLYPTSSSGVPPKDITSRTFEHLACFLPGLFALGVETLPLDNLETLGVNFQALGAGLKPSGQDEYQLLANYKLSDLHRWAADGMTEACATMYADQPSGLGPDEVVMSGSSVRWIDELEKWRKAGSKGSPPGVGKLEPVREIYGQPREEKEYYVRRPSYELRPETIESVFIMWRLTRDERWRVHGWNMFQAIERETKTESGYTAVQNVGFSPAKGKDSMPSYFLAETLKYLYLLFTDEELVPLHDWIFNTEAHPLPVWKWTADEKERFEIP
ncbi:mannosidase [Amylostereum chailletii]|nr:mannosidase [Amylostereum chailletii]